MTFNSVKYYSDADSEIVLRAIKQSRRVVVDLNDSNINSIARTNIDTTSESCRKPRFLFREIEWTRRSDHRCTNVRRYVDAIATMCDTRERVDEWLELCFGGVVFDLNAPKKVKKTRLDVYAIRETRHRNIDGLEVSGKISLEPDVSGDVTRKRSVESMKSFALVDDVLQIRIRIAYAGVDPVM